MKNFGRLKLGTPDNGEVLVRLLSNSTHLRKENAITNHFDGIIVDPTRSQEQEIDRLMEQVVSRSQKTKTLNYRDIYEKEGPERRWKRK